MPENPAVKVERSISPAALQAVGYLLFAASGAETMLTFTLQRLVRHPEPHRLAPILAGKETRLKINLIRMISAHEFPKETCLPVLCDKVQKAFKKRDFVAHNLFGPTDDPDVIEIFPVKLTGKGVWPDESLHSCSEITQWAESISEACLRLDQRLTELGVPKVSLSDASMHFWQ